MSILKIRRITSNYGRKGRKSPLTPLLGNDKSVRLANTDRRNLDIGNFDLALGGELTKQSTRLGGGNLVVRNSLRNLGDDGELVSHHGKDSVLYGTVLDGLLGGLFLTLGSTLILLGDNLLSLRLDFLGDVAVHNGGEHFSRSHNYISFLALVATPFCFR